MLKRSLTILITIVYLSGLFSPFYVYAGYLINKNYIAANLCENKNKPELHCNGKCYLNDQMAAVTEQSTDTDNKTPAVNNLQDNTPHDISNFTFTIFEVQANFLFTSMTSIDEGINYSSAVSAPPEFSACV